MPQAILAFGGSHWKSPRQASKRNLDASEAIIVLGENLRQKRRSLERALCHSVMVRSILSKRCHELPMP
jgi:hypothetical protein